MMDVVWRHFGCDPAHCHSVVAPMTWWWVWQSGLHLLEHWRMRPRAERETFSINEQISHHVSSTCCDKVLAASFNFNFIDWFIVFWMPTLTCSQTDKVASVSVNWLFLDQTCELKLCCVEIPQDLFTANAMHHCQPLFATQLKMFHKFEARIPSIGFFKVLPHSSFSSHISYTLQPKVPAFINSSWQETFLDRTVHDNLKEIHLPCRLSDVLKGNLDYRRLHLLVTVEPAVGTGAAYVHGEADNVITELGLPKMKCEYLLSSSRLCSSTQQTKGISIGYSQIFSIRWQSEIP